MIRWRRENFPEEDFLSWTSKDEGRKVECGRCFGSDQGCGTKVPGKNEDGLGRGLLGLRLFLKGALNAGQEARLC